VGGKKLIDLIGQMYSLTERGEAPCECLPIWPDTGTFSAHTLLIKNLYEQQWVNLGYCTISCKKPYFISCINKLSSRNTYKAFELGEMYAA
jgi:hypothetical protein